MKKAVVGVLLGAVTYFIWGAVSWMAIPWHKATVKNLPEETLITDVMKTVIKEPGFYLFPHDMTIPAPNEPDGKKAWAMRYRQGPVGALVFSPEGRVPMDPMVFVKQFVAGLVSAGFLMLILAAARDRYKTLLCRTGLAAAVGFVAGISVHCQHRLWFAFPMDYTLVGVADLVIGFALMGAAMAKLVPEA